MADLFFNIPTYVFFGLDTINRIGKIISELGKHVLLVTESILYEKKTIDRVTNLLSQKNIECIIYDEIKPNAVSSSIDSGVKLARGAKIDVIIGLGGIKTLSIAKCIAMTAPCDKEMDDFLTDDYPDAEPIPFVEIPTTCRDPFMLTNEYFVIDARDRTGKIGYTQENITKYAIIDPKLSGSLPIKYTATTIMDTLSGAIEGHISKKNNFLSDTFLVKAISLLGNTLITDQENLDDLKSRVKASMGGLMTAMGLNASKPGIASALSFALNAKCKIPKSWTTTVLLPHILEYYSKTNTEKIAAIGKMMDSNMSELSTTEAVNKTIELIRSLSGNLGLPNRFRDFNLNLDDMVEVAEIAHSYDMMNYIPRTTSTEDLYEIIRSAF
jgi:alcohol dehydrogenase